MNIKEFKKGDIITRTEPMYYTDEMGGSRSNDQHIGKKMEYVGNLNGCIYLKIDNQMINVMKSFGVVLPKDKEDKYKTMISLPFYSWQEGWEMWVDPKSAFGIDDEKITGLYGIAISQEEMMNQVEDDETPEIPLESAERDWLERKLKEAEQTDDFERAMQIKNELDKRFNSKRS